MGERLDIGEALDRFLLQLRANGRSPHTLEQFTRHVRLLERWCRAEGRSTAVADLGIEDVASFVASPVARLRPDGQEKKPSSMNVLRTSVRCFFRYLHDVGAVEINPARLLERARVGPACPRALTTDEQKRLLAVLGEASTRAERRDRVLFVLMLRTGIRIGTALALDSEDVDLGSGVLRVRTLKGSGEARVLVPRELHALLEGHLGALEPGPVFRGDSGRRLSRRYTARVFSRYLERARILRVRGSHCLRHSFATNLLRRTGDLALVQKALCHASIASTVMYTHVEDERLRTALDG